MTIPLDLLTALHTEFPGTFPSTPPKPVQRPNNFFRPGSKPWSEDSDPPVFSDFSAIVGFLPFLEPAVGNSAIAKYETYRAAVLESFGQAIKDAKFIYPLQLNADAFEKMYRCDLDWVATTSLDDLRRFLCKIFSSTNSSGFEDNVINGVIPAILKRFRDSPRTSVEELFLLILSFDPMCIDYGNYDEYEPEALDILINLPSCNCVEDAQSMMGDVFHRWFHDDRPIKEYTLLSYEIWSWYQSAKENLSSMRAELFAREDRFRRQWGLPETGAYAYQQACPDSAVGRRTESPGWP